MIAAVDPTSDTTRPDHPIRPDRRARWPIAGVVAGTTALFATLTGMDSTLTEEQHSIGVDVIDQLDRGTYHVAFLVGLVSVAALLVAASGWRRWARHHGPDDLAAGYVASGLAATATVNLIGFCLMGSMALYLPGGMDEGWLSREGIFANYNYLDFGVLFGWWTTLFAAGAVAVMAFGRARLLPRWMGVVSIVVPLPAVVFAVLVSLPGFPGLVMPIWLVIISIGMVLSRTAEA
jgi:hypothetical protein